MDFGNSVSKLEKEREKRRKVLEEKKKAERKAQAKYEEMQSALALAAEQRAVLLQEQQAEREIAENQEQQRSLGIKFKMNLKPVPCEGEDDKVIIPPSILETLSRENVFANGPIMFQIRNVSSANSKTSRISHCGVREFTAEEGTIHLPPKVFRSLTPQGSAAPSMVEIEYLVLPSIKFVKFQPKLNVFSHVGPVKLVLEENLRLHSTLTLGDTVTVWYRGASYELEAKEIVPDDPLYNHGGSLVNTDVEVDIDVSQEYIEKQGLKPDEASSTGQVCGQGTGQVHTLSSSLPPPPVHPASSAQCEDDMDTSSEPIAAVPDEPRPDSEGVVTCKVSLPGGTSITRRMLRTSDIATLFLFIRSTQAAVGAHDLKDKTLQLSTRFPSRKFVENDASSMISFESAGITSSNEAFMLGFAN
jgi:hypothetical protein